MTMKISMKTLMKTLTATSLLFTLAHAAPASEPGSPASDYPRPLMFRSNSPENVEAAGHRIGMIISDQHVPQRRYSDELFKKLYPDKPVIIHVAGDYISANAYTSQQMMEDRGMLKTPLAEEFIKQRGGYKELLSPDFLPMPDFLGYWVYEPGTTIARPIPADQQVVTLAVADPTRFEPVVPVPRARMDEIAEGTDVTTTARVVVICPRDAKGQLDWLRGELGEVVATNKAAKTVTVRRFKTSHGWPELLAGSYLASNASRYNRGDSWGMKHTPKGHPYHVPLWPWMMPNFASFAPVDPRTGLNAAQWFAKHFIDRKQKYYLHCDGFALGFFPGFSG